MDAVIDQVYNLSRGAYVALFCFQEVSMSKFPNGPVFIIVVHIINGAMNTYMANKSKPRAYWLHSLATTILGCFGGGIITPVILGARPSIIFANELAIPCSVLIWYLINYCGFESVFNWKPMKLLLNMFVSLWRTNATINVVTLGCTALKPSVYYPTPLFGPLIGGTLVNTLGAFVPFDKGLSAIEKGTPWAIQSAFVSAALYFFIVKDRDGCIGIAVRSVVGDLSHRTVAGIIVGMQMLTLASQVIFDDLSANFFTPIHQFFYYALRLQGPPEPASPAASATSPVKPKPPVGFTFASFAVVVRIIAGALFGVYLLSLRIPPVTLPAVARSAVFQKNGADYVTFSAAPTASLSTARPIGTCQWRAVFPFLPASQCKTFALVLEEHHKCVNETCTSLAECTTPERAGCTMAALQGKHIDSAAFRLAVHPSAGVHYALPSLIRTASAEQSFLVNTNMRWATSLPLEIASAEQLASIDPKFQFSAVSLFLSKASELFLVSDVEFGGSVFDPAKITAKVIWSGTPRHTCASQSEEVATTAVAAEALYLDAVTGAPRLQCSDGSSVELDIGEVYRDRWAGLPPALPAASAPIDLSAGSAKAEL